MNYILFDDARRSNFLPLTFTRPLADIRFGILTIREKWEKFLGVKTSSLTENYLRKKFPVVKEPDNILINGAICPNTELIAEINKLQPNQALIKNDIVIAMRLTEQELEKSGTNETSNVTEFPTEVNFTELLNIWDIFSKNGIAIQADFELITKGRKSQKLGSAAHVVNPENIFVEKGANIGFAVLNASKGPVYIGENTEVMEGSFIRGPFALCDNSVVKIGAKIYGPTTIGPHSKVGGEVNNSVIFGYSNKAHDGFLGHSVLGEWCNLGADTNTSNLKNTYDTIRLWSYAEQTFVDTSLQFCGLIMGDHSKSGINTMFNTGTVVGVSSNIFGGNFQRNFISSFAWGGYSGFTTFDVNKAIKVAEAVYRRRNMELSDIDKELLKHVFNITFKYRKI
ncbi:MAG: GlmU family protein [Bacteroidales bacterium]|nr:GlmU family protein [Bacteroidales bacterium]